jgi:Tfp pilus assembly protein PilN
MRRALLAFSGGVVLGIAAGVAAGWLRWGHAAATMAQRLDSTLTQVQGERDRLRHELDDIARERHEMADAAERLRAAVERQQERLEGLARELAEPRPDDRGGPAPPPDAVPSDPGQ